MFINFLKKYKVYCILFCSIILLASVGFACFKYLFNNDINIVLISNRNNTLRTQIIIQSLIDTKKTNKNYNIFVYTPDLRTETFNNPFLYPKMKGIKIKMVPIDSGIIKKMAKNMGIPDNKVNDSIIRIPEVFSFVLPDLLPKSYSKVLYLSNYTLVLKDLEQFYNTDISKYYLAAVPVSNQAISNAYGIGYDNNVMLLNLDKLRQQHVVGKFYKLFNEFVFKEPDSIFKLYNSVVSLKDVKVLPITYNFRAKSNQKERFDDDMKMILVKYGNDVEGFDKMPFEKYIPNVVVTTFLDRPWHSDKGNITFADKWKAYEKRLALPPIEQPKKSSASVQPGQAK